MTLALHIIAPQHSIKCGSRNVNKQIIQRWSSEVGVINISSSYPPVGGIGAGWETGHYNRGIIIYDTIQLL